MTTAWDKFQEMMAAATTMARGKENV